VPSWARRFGDEDEYDDYGYIDTFGGDEDAELDAELAAYGIDPYDDAFPVGSEAPFPPPRRIGREVY
jgi:hypothetical protein